MILLWLWGHDGLNNSREIRTIPLRLPCFYSIRSEPRIIHKEAVYGIARQILNKNG